MLSLIDRLLVERPALSVLVTTGTVTSARLLADAAAARPRLAPIRAGRPRRLCAPVSRSLAARPGAVGRIRALAQSDHRDLPQRHSAAAVERAHVAAVLPRLAARAGTDHSAAWPISISAWRRTRCRRKRLARLGASAAATVGNLKAAAAPLPADQGELARLAASCAGRPLWLAASAPMKARRKRWRRAHVELRQRASRALHHHRAASSGARRRDRGRACARRACAWRGARAASRSRIRPTSTSPIRWASSACSIAWPASPSSAAR